MIYYRPLVQQGHVRPDGACVLAGGPLWFTHVEALSRTEPARVLAACDIPPAALDRLSAARASIAGLDMGQPQIMGILNVTPDSFSDGGRHNAPEAAIKAALGMIGQGAGMIDIGGESTRPGAALVPDSEEVARTVPVIAGLRRQTDVPLSIDTRKAAVARAAIEAGAGLINDVSGFTYDPALAPLAAQSGLPVCVMHAQGDPATMQQAPQYDNVLLDVYDFLETQVTALERAGIARDQVVVDPGIGFGKTTVHNLVLLHNISLFHGLGCAILLGASRKRFIGEVGNAPPADARAPGSIAVGLAALGQGVQILRVHDVAETAQAIRLWQAVWDEGNDA
ncbi:MAG: dihydropteroate synthase [Rhodobacteraceae bacterium]|nr:MAG: dihydropteroate synthase [Paracoccaceae bacterium]